MRYRIIHSDVEYLIKMYEPIGEIGYFFSKIMFKKGHKVLYPYLKGSRWRLVVLCEKPCTSTLANSSSLKSFYAFRKRLEMMWTPHLFLNSVG